MNAEVGRVFLNFFVQSMEFEFETTKKVIRAVPEDKKSYRPDEKARTAHELAWHIAQSEVWFADGVINGQFAMGESQDSTPATISGIIDWYDKNFRDRVSKLKALPADKLVQIVPFFGFELPAVSYLNFLGSHSAHHRGQLAVYLRPMGAKVPSIYGGSADEPFQMEAKA